GNLTWSQADQVADTASITVNTGLMNLGNRPETLTNLTIHDGSVVQNFSGANITGVLTVTAGVKHDAVNSGGNTTANQAILSDTILFLGANSGDSVLNIGIGGISFTNASISFGSLGDAARHATTNLDGDVTSAGESAFFVNSGDPISELNLGFASRTFNVTDGTLRVGPSIVSFGIDVGVIKTGPGAMVLAAGQGTNTNGESNYSGPTTVQEGTLLVNGSITGSTVTVGANGTLGGVGTINGDVVVNGTLAPGDPEDFFMSALTLGTTGLTFGANSRGNFELEDFFFDQVLGIDQLTLDGTIAVSLTNGFQPMMNDTFDLFEFSAINASGFDLNADLLLPALNPGLQWDRSQFLTEGVLVVIPEPLSSSIFVAGLGLVAGLRRRRR
ncbi:MAG: PEP-CTERM sorting domain-containing protein, partial [Chthoniobacteraceae bacterium]